MTVLKVTAVLLALILFGFGCRQESSTPAPTQSASTKTNTYPVTGTFKELQTNGTAVIAHDEVTNYMPAMTMAFNVRNSNEVLRLQPGDRIAFRLSVTEDESWIDQIVLKARPPRFATTATNSTASASITNRPKSNFSITNIPDFSFTNEFGQPVSMRDFQGKAIAFTFFFTRCPIPEYCPRLSKNFQGASKQLLADPNASTNWHLLSISFDPFDTPAVLRAYGKSYNYNSNHWSFLTGRTAQMTNLAYGFGVKISGDPGNYAHGFATVIFDAEGRLQARWPVGGDTTSTIVSELRKGMSVTNGPRQ